MCDLKEILVSAMRRPFETLVGFSIGISIYLLVNLIYTLIKLKLKI